MSQLVTPSSLGATIPLFLKLQKSSTKEMMVGQSVAKLKLKFLLCLETIITHQKRGKIFLALGYLAGLFQK